jgi:hypothetical protein
MTASEIAMKPVPASKQQALVNRLMKASGGAYSPATRRKYYISGPQWAAAYQGQALFHAPTREAIGFEDVICEYEKIGIGHWATHDTDVIPTAALGKDEQWAIVSRIQKSLTTLGATANTHWGRIFYKVQNPSAVDNAHVLHTTFVSVIGGAQENRIVDTVEAQGNHTHQWLFNNPDDGGSAGSAYSWTFDAAWHCAEWYINLTTQSFRFFSDSTEVRALAFVGGNHEMPAAYMALVLGATYYQGDPLTGPFTMWIDDLAIDDNQIGCQ